MIAAPSGIPVRLGPPVVSCEAAWLRQREVLRDYLRQQASLGGSTSLDGLCLPDEKGAWAIVFGEVALLGGREVGWVGLRGQWAAARVGLDGQELGRSESVPFYFHGEWGQLTAYRWNKQDAPGVLLISGVAQEDSPGKVDTGLRALRFHEGRVGLAPGTEKLDLSTSPMGTEDVDGDGLRDLYYQGPFQGRSGERQDFLIPRMVAHGLPDGSFSATDDLARRASFQGMTTCALDPSPGADTGEDPYMVAAAVRCFALLGQPARAAATAARCPDRQSGWCQLARRWVHVKSPFPPAAAPPAPVEAASR
jgi:hypothetical protein